MWREELAQQLKEVDPPSRKKLLASYSRRTGHSMQALYRIAKENGFNTGRKPRADKGECALTPRQVELVASLIYTTRREVKGPIMPVECALEIAVDNGIIEPGQVSPDRMTELLRDRQINKGALKAPEPYTPMRSLHPNHCHVFDVSVCVQYYLKGGKGMMIMDERDFYKNKPDKYMEIKTRLLRYLVADHFSGAFYLYYYDAKGETQEQLYDFLVRAWSHKNDERYPFRGVPRVMLMDAGAANMGKMTLAFLERLGVFMPPGMPYNPTRQGAVEALHNIVEGWFESKLRIRPANTIEDLNAWAYDFLVWFHAAKKHTRHEMKRTECWMLIQPDQLRELPSINILQDLYASPEEERTVGGEYEISYRGKEYNLKHVPGVFHGAKVQAILKPWKWPSIDVRYQEALYEAAPIEMLPRELGGFRADAAIIGQEYRAQPETLTQQAMKRFENMAYGEPNAERGIRNAESIPFAGLKVFGHQAEKIGNLAYMEKKGTPIEVDRSITESSISITEFLKRLVQRVGPITPEMNRDLRARYGEAISLDDVDTELRNAECGMRNEEQEKKAAM